MTYGGCEPSQQAILDAGLRKLNDAGLTACGSMFKALIEQAPCSVRVVISH
ncbi:hypothetical protein [Polaromonas sp.]|uniref:hypothetical protein n=1 Tax=Polaromonas sp. TaxID=1869339 RepID=UPI00185AAE3D|nr:hypothetical protein [Polaromonas sp.]NML85829.1 hypothetical protein [Polaromonas sp.]